MGKLRKYCHRMIFTLLLISASLNGQVNCNIFDNEDCKKACELANLAETSQGIKQSQLAFDKAIELCPNFSYAFREKSVPYLKRGDFITWKKLIDKAVELNPFENLGYRGWCQYQFLRNYKAALIDIENFEKLVGSDNMGFSQNGNYHLEIVKALCYKGLGDKFKAIDLFEIQFNKKNYSPMLFDYYHLGVLYFEVGNLEKAKETLEKQISNNDYFAEPYYYLSLIYAKENNMVLAKKMITKAQIFYSENKFIKDSYTTPQDKIFEKNIFFFKKKLH